MKKNLLFLLIVFLQAIVSQAQVVNPLQAGHYTVACINVRDYTKPPPGMLFMLYNTYSWGNSYIDRNGNKLTDINLSQIDPSLPDVSVNMQVGTFASIPLIAWASKFNVLGARYFPMVLPPGYIHAHTKAFGEKAFGSIDSTATFNESGTTSGFGDMFVQPVGLYWGGDVTDFMITYGFYAPTGRFEEGADDNIGLGFWTHQLQAFDYLYPVKDKSTAFMLGLTYEANGKIKGSDVKPGQRLSLEWGISQYLTDRLEVCVQGGNNWQITDDKGEDVWWDPSVHDRKSTAAFSINYWVVANRLYFGFRYGFDFALRQRFKTNMGMFHIMYTSGLWAGKKNSIRN